MRQKNKHSENINYLLVGHLAKDLPPKNLKRHKLGGGVLYSGAAAKVLGAKVGVITSYPKELNKEVLQHPFFKNAVIKNIPSRRATTFRNLYEDQKRIQYLYDTAVPITTAGFLTTGLGKQYFKPSIVHLAPIAREIDLNLMDKVKADFFGASLQGWLRKRDSNDRVHYCAWPDYKLFLPKLDAAVLSEEDSDHNIALVKEFAKHTKVLVLTRGKNGCLVFSKGKKKEFKPKKILNPTNTTGAGDVFAAGFFTRFFQTKNPFTSADFANKLAAFHLEKGIENLK